MTTPSPEASTSRPTAETPGRESGLTKFGRLIATASLRADADLLAKAVARLVARDGRLNMPMNKVYQKAYQSGVSPEALATVARVAIADYVSQIEGQPAEGQAAVPPSVSDTVASLKMTNSGQTPPGTASSSVEDPAPTKASAGPSRGIEIGK